MPAPAPTDLRAPGAVLLVSCYELGHPPYGLALAAAFLERAGFHPATLDLATQPLDAAALQTARFVGISVPMHTALRLGMRFARRLRELNSTCRICFYGLYAPLHAQVLLDGCADWVLGGEYEANLVTLVERCERDPAEAADIAPAAIALTKLAFPVPSRATLPPLSSYARLESDGIERLAGYVEASRGCLHRCTHCPIPAVYDGRFFVIPPSVVLEDVRAQVEAGATHITFGDPDFLNGPGHALQVVRLVHREFPSLTFDITAKIEHLLAHRDVLPELRSLGVIFVVTAVESLSDVVLGHLEKGHVRADVEAALRLLRAADITMRPSLLPFTPWSTLDDYLELVDWIAAEDLVDSVDPVQLTIRLLVPPGSLLLESAAMRSYLGALDPEALTYTWRHPDARMDALQRRASRVVEAAGAQQEDAPVTFHRLRALALASRDAESDDCCNQQNEAVLPGLTNPKHRDRPRSPRLTESWFCCAEPTAGQLDPLQNPELT